MFGKDNDPAWAREARIEKSRCYGQRRPAKERHEGRQRIGGDAYGRETSVAYGSECLDAKEVSSEETLPKGSALGNSRQAIGANQQKTYGKDQVDDDIGDEHDEEKARPTHLDQLLVRRPEGAASTDDIEGAVVVDQTGTRFAGNLITQAKVVWWSIATRLGRLVVG